VPGEADVASGARAFASAETATSSIEPAEGSGASPRPAKRRRVGAEADNEGAGGGEQPQATGLSGQVNRSASEGNADAASRDVSMRRAAVATPSFAERAAGSGGAVAGCDAAAAVDSRAARPVPSTPPGATPGHLAAYDHIAQATAAGGGSSKQGRLGVSGSAAATIGEGCASAPSVGSKRPRPNDVS
jgi:hypothetical protein